MFVFQIMEDGLIQQIQEANYILQSVLFGLQELGEHEGNLALLLSFGVHVYENLRRCFLEIQTTLMNSVGCNQQSLRVCLVFSFVNCQFHMLFCKSC